MGSNDKSVMVQDTNRSLNKSEDNRNPVSEENEKLQSKDNNTLSIQANNNNIDIQESAQDSNTRSIDVPIMVQDSELPKNNNLNTEINTHCDDKENKNTLPEDSNKTDTITANDQNINDNNKDTDIQNSN